MPLRFSMGIGSLGDENLILLTGLKETLKPKCERILEILKEIEEKKGKTTGLRDWSEWQTECLGFLNLYKTLSMTEGM